MKNQYAHSLNLLHAKKLTINIVLYTNAVLLIENWKYLTKTVKITVLNNNFIKYKSQQQI